MNWNHRPNYPFLPNFDFCHGVHHDNRNKTKSSSNISFKMLLFTLQTVSQTRNLRSLAWQPLLSFKRPEHIVNNTEILRNPFTEEKRDEDKCLQSIHMPAMSSAGGQEEKFHIKKRQCRKPSTGPAAEHGALTEVSPVSRLNFYNQPHFSNIKWKPLKVDIAWGLERCLEGQGAASLLIVSTDDSQPCYPPPGAPLSVEYAGCVCYPPESHSVALLGTKPCSVGLELYLIMAPNCKYGSTGHLDMPMRRCKIFPPVEKGKHLDLKEEKCWVWKALLHNESSLCEIMT